MAAERADLLEEGTVSEDFQPERSHRRLLVLASGLALAATASFAAYFRSRDVVTPTRPHLTRWLTKGRDLEEEDLLDELKHITPECKQGLKDFFSGIGEAWNKMLEECGKKDNDDSCTAAGEKLQEEADKLDKMAEGVCPDDYMACDLYTDGVADTMCAPSVCKPINILKEGVDSEGPDADIAVECDGHDKLTPADIPADAGESEGNESEGNESEGNESQGGESEGEESQGDDDDGDAEEDDGDDEDEDDSEEEKVEETTTGEA